MAAGDDRGFTVLELLVVIAIASVISVIAAVGLPDLSNRLAMERLGSAIEREIIGATWRARKTGTDQIVRFDEATRSLALPDGRSVVFDRETSATWLGAAEGRPSGSDGMLTIFGGGGASGGELLLTRGGHKIRITIDWLSARPTRTTR
jgi:general secretion pathway protein H